MKTKGFPSASNGLPVWELDNHYQFNALNEMDPSALSHSLHHLSRRPDEAIFLLSFNPYFFISLIREKKVAVEHGGQLLSISKATT